MNVRTTCLALLFFEDRTGYDIRKYLTDGQFSFFVEASYGSIYPALNRMEEEQLVTCRHEAQEGKPARKVYSITDAGRQALMNELLLAHKPDVYRSEFLLIAIFARFVGPDTTAAAIERQIAYHEQELAHINGYENSEQEEQKKPSDPEAAALFEETASWAQNYGRYCVSANIDYLKRHGGELVEIARNGIAPLKVSSGS